MKNNIKDIYSLTPSQEGMYAQYYQSTETKSYQIWNLSKINKEADLDNLKKSVVLLSLRHQVLKTAFTVLKTTGAIKQVILENRKPKFSIFTLDTPYIQDALDKIVDEHTKQAFDLQKDSLLRVTIIDFTDARFMLMHAHHIILDGWCLPVLIHDLQNYYGALADGVSVENLTEEINKEVSSQTSYAQYTNWMKKQDTNGALAYWQNLLADCSPAHIFGKEKKDNIKNEDIVTFKTPLSDALSQHIEQFAKENKVSPNTVFECAFAITLQKYAGSEDIIFDKIISGRSIPLKNIENTVGPFINTVPVRIKCDTNSTLTDLLTETQTQTINANRHGILSLAEVYKACGIEAKSIDALFVFENYFTGDMADIERGSLSPKLISYDEQTEFNLTITILKENNGYTIRASYAKELYTERDISGFVQGYLTILETSLDGAKQIKNICTIPETELHTLLHTFNDTALPYTTDKGVYELFEEQVKLVPNKTAVAFKETSLSYLELEALVQDYANRLVSLGAGEQDVIAIHLERSHKLIAFQLAVLKIGAIFLPVDKRYPTERIAHMCENCDVTLLISDELSKESIRANIIPLHTFHSIITDKFAETIHNLDVCYIIYTSGSTGTPKGCMLTGKGLLNFCKNNNTLETLREQEDCIFACVNSVSFDYFIAESLLPLTNGYTTVILDDQESTMQKQFLNVVEQHHINVVMTTPTRLKIYFNDKYNCDVLKQLTCISTSGEPLTPELLAQMYEKSPLAQIYNPLGPSECTVWDVGGRLNKADGIDIHLGKPIANAQLYILDQYLNPVPINVIGELCIAGDGVGAGYLNNPTLTAERFVDNPFGDGKLYRTGDLAYWREDGNIGYIGRNDFQVKIRGLRIELGEIESAIANIADIHLSVVVVRKAEDGRQLLCAFYTGEEKSPQELREALSNKLPKYMVPHIFTHLDDMPMTASGKINRLALPEVDFNISEETEFVVPNTQEEKALAEVVCSVLKISSINMLDNFFNIGGDSINAIYIVAELEGMGYELHVADMMQKDTLLEIAEAMKSTSNSAIYDQGEVTGTIPFSPIMRAFLQESNHSIPKEFVHTGIVSADCDESTARKALDALVSHHDILRGTFCDSGIKIHPSGERDVYAFNTITMNNTDEAKEYLNNNIKIDDDKLITVVFCNTERENLISITIHHFLIDLISWEVLMEDFKVAVNQLKNKEEISLPAKTASFLLWNEELQNYAQTISHETKAYWENVNFKLNNANTIFTSQENEAERYSFTLDADIASKLMLEVNATYGTRTNEVLLTALGLAAGTIADGSVGIMVESHGRTELHKAIAIERTIGWFTSCYPVVIENNSNVTDTLIETKETMRSIPKNGIEYLLLSQSFHKNTDIIFNFYQNNVAEEKRKNEFIAFHSETSLIPNKISVDCTVLGNNFIVTISVPKCKHKLQIAEELGMEFQKQIEKLVAACTATGTVVKTRSDFSDDELTETELGEIKELFDLQYVEDIYPLTAAQEGMYVQYFQSTETKTYQLRNVSRINKEADLDKLQKSVALLSLRHPILKTAFTVLKSTGAMKQVVLENRKPKFSIIPQDMPFSQEILEKIVDEHTKEAFDLQKDSLFRVTIVEFTDARFMLMHTHHIILDGWCLPVLIHDLQNYYGALADGVSVETLTEEIDKEVSSQTSYAQYANWIKKQDTNEVSSYWQNLLADCSPAHIFGKEKKDNIKNEDMVTFKIPLEAETSRHIEQFAKESKISPNTVFECAFCIALQKYSGSEDIVFDKIISGRSIPLKNIENTVGPFINTVPVRIKCDASSTFADLLNETQKQTIHANQYGVLSLAEVYKTCGIAAKSIDALFIFENYFTGDISDIERGPLSPNLIFADEQTEFNLTVTILKERNGYEIRASYAKELYTEREILSFVQGYLTILTSSLDGAKQMKDICAISETELHTLLHTFNETAVPYPTDRFVHQLFETQAAKTPDTVAVLGCDKTLTYKELNEEANRIAHALLEMGISKGDTVAFMLPRRSYLLSAQLGILKAGAFYLPIDPDHPQDRISYMLSDSGAKYCITEDNITALLNHTNTENPNVTVDGNDICYCIYTSGSTGQPKGTLLTHRNVLNFVWNDKNNVFHNIIKEDYNTIVSITTVGFDIFVTESLLPLANGMTIVLANEEEARQQSKLNALLTEHPVSVLQTTPTKMQSLIGDKEQRTYLQNLKAIILGGEAFNSALATELRTITDAEIFNIYGPTETTVWVTNTKVTANDIHIGRPMINTQIYIVDDYLNPVPIGVTGELCIAGDCVGAGYLNNPALTAEKFIDNPFGQGKLYRTGDIAYWRDDGNIGYVGRNDFQVKIRGLRIELGEIETAMASLEDILLSAVVVRKNAEGRQFLCAFYTGKPQSDRELRQALRDKLPKYMIPHIFTHLEEMPLNTSGKISRNALPETDLAHIESDTIYVAPQTEAEHLVVASVEAVLSCDKVSVLDNFFDLGGDSLKAIELISKLEVAGYTVPMKEIFEAQTIQDLAIQLVSSQETVTLSYDRVMPATPAQMRVYTAQSIASDLPLYNISYAFKVEQLDVGKLEAAINQLIARHESLHTHFENQNGTIMQVIDDAATVEIIKLENDAMSQFVRPFDLTKSPLLRVGYHNDTVLMDIHHIIFDGESAHVFFQELADLYMGRTLSSSAVQYGEFAVEKQNLTESEQYWLSVFEEEVPKLTLPTDYARKEKQSFTGSSFHDLIDLQLHEQVTEKAKVLGITPYAFYMACFNILLAKYSGNEDITLGMPISGRSSKFLNTIGMFVNTIALRSKPEGAKTVATFMQEVRDASVAAMEHQNYPLGELVNKLHDSLFDVMFAYQREEKLSILLGETQTELVPFTGTTAKYDFTFTLIPTETDVAIVVDYCTDLYKEQTIRRFVDSFKRILTLCLNEQTLIQDISAISEQETKALLYDFNDTATTYPVPADATIYSLFAQRAMLSPGKTCIATSDSSMTFGDFLSVTETLDGQIRSVTNGTKSIIAVIAERSLEMYTAIYGIIRGGNAYLPIAPDYPADRIAYILKDSGAALVITQEQFTHLAEDVPCIDMTAFLKNTPAISEVPPCIAEPNDTAYVIYTSGSTGNPKGAKISHKSAINRILWMHDSYPMTENSVILQKTPYTFDVSVWELFWWGMCNGSLAVSKPGEHFLPAKILEAVYKHQVTHLHFVPSVFDLFLTYLEAHKELCAQFQSVKYVFLSGEALSASSVQRFYTLFDYEKVTLHNLYGPTECAVDVTYYDCTPSDCDPVPIGRPIANTSMYVLDQHQNILPQGVMGELCIGGVNVGQGYLNNPTLTAEKFIDNPFASGKLYRTGDLAYIREDGQIIFCGRMDSQIKLNGQRIELGEIEAAIAGLANIERAVVIVRNTEDGRQLLCAFYTGEPYTTDALRQTLRDKLPKYMIPHIFTHLAELPLNTSGKVNRKALPEIDLAHLESNTVHVAPQTETEQLLATSIEAVLECNNISLLDNFFDLGGDSLKAIALISKLEESGYTLQMKQIFDAQTIQDLAKSLCAAEETVTLSYDRIMPATPAQIRVYTAQFIAADTPLYNISYAFKVEQLDIGKLETAINQLVARHESLRTHFENQNGTIMQVIEDAATVKITKLESDSMDQFVQPFDLTKAPLLRVGYHNNTILMDIHHIIFDGESAHVFFQELVDLYMGRSLPSLPIQYGEFAAEQQDLTESEQYWLSVFEEDVPELTLPLDYAKNEKPSFQGTSFHDLIDANLHQQIKEKANDLGITPYAFYMGCFNILLSKYSGKEDIVVGMPVSGRSSKFLNTIGMFVNTIALRNKPDGNKTVADFMQEVRNTSVAAMEHQNYPLGELVNKLHHSLFDVMFAYQREEKLSVMLDETQTELVPFTGTTAKYDFTFTVVPTETDVAIIVDYCTDLYKEQTIARFVDSFKQILHTCLNEQMLLKDISVVSEEERKALLQLPITKPKATTKWEAPKTEEERFICEAFRNILQVENIGRNSDFFTLGGTSLSMISLLSEDDFSNISAADFMSNSTPAKLAAFMNNAPTHDFMYVETLLKNNHAKKAFVIFPFAGGGAESYTNLVTAIKQKRDDYAIYFVPYLHTKAECEVAAQEVATLSKQHTIYFYSHCVGSAVAMQVLACLEEAGTPCVKHYIAGASIPPHHPRKHNSWDGVSDKKLKATLVKAGAPLEQLSQQECSAMLTRFREDTDFATQYFYNMKHKISCPVSIVISKEDLFTKNYKKAEKMWNLYVETVDSIHFIDSTTHYFQSEHSKELAHILFNY